MPGSIIIISNPRQQVKIQDPRYNIPGTKFKTNNTWYKIYMYEIQSAWYLVRGTRLQGTAVVPGAGTSSLRTNRKEYRRKVISCFIQ